MATFSLGKQLTSNSSGTIELCNVRRFYEEVRSEFPTEYWLDCNCILEALDLSSNITESSLAKAPLPAVDIKDTQADKAVKVSENWKNYPAIGLQLHIDYGNGQYLKKGQPIVVQNTPVQFPVPLISPYLNATAAVFVLGKNDRIGVSILSNYNWQQIKSNDFITITGAVRLDISPKELKQIAIKSWNNISKSLITNKPTKILNSNKKRRYLSLVNASTSKIYCGFGSTIDIDSGNLLIPNGAYVFDSEKYYTDAEFWAVSLNGNGLLVGQEGSI